MPTSESRSKSDVVRFQQFLDYSRHVVNVPLLLLRQSDVRHRQNEHRQQTCPAFATFLRQENALSQRHQLTDIASSNRVSKEITGYLVGNCSVVPRIRSALRVVADVIARRYVISGAVTRC